MSLTNVECQKAKPAEKKYKIFDGRGLFLEIRPNGAKYWRMKYRYLGKEKLLALGVFPEISLAEARDKCLAARKLLDGNIDPSGAKQEARRLARQNADNSFESIAREWHDNFKDKWSERHAKTVLKRLETDIFPEIGSMPIAEIKPAHIIEVLKKIQKRGAYEPAHRLRQYCSQVFRHAITLDPACETPASRTYKNPHVLSDLFREREHYVSAALTIIRAWIAAGKPETTCKPLVSYGEWSELCRQPLLWLGLPDPTESMFAAMNDDPERDTLGRLLLAWKYNFGNTPKMIRDAVNKAQENFSGDLYEAIHDIAQDRQGINRRILGHWIRRNTNRIVDGLRFVPAGGSRSAAAYRVESVSSVSSEF